jgi:hypothetical protein
VNFDIIPSRVHKFINELEKPLQLVASLPLWIKFLRNLAGRHGLGVGVALAQMNGDDV